MASASPSQRTLSDDTRKLSLCTRIMAYHPEIWCFLIAAILSLITRYGQSVKSKPLVVAPAEPKQFFPNNSLVIDVPYGDLNIVFDNVIDHEFVMVMYYAPWCAKCMQVRWEFHQAAKHLQNVKFIAVNCWWWRGPCRQRFKFLMFPVLIAYKDRISGFKYSGILSADHIVKYIDDMFFPLKYLRSANDVKEFTSANDNSLIGYFAFNESPQPPGFLQFYYASLRLIAADPHQPVRCGIISRKDLFSLYGIKCFERILLSRTGNSTLKYPLLGNLTSSAITRWVSIHRQADVVRWIVPSGVKSLTLSQEINKGPALILFTPVNSLFDINIYFHALKKVALVYRNCNGTGLSEIAKVNSIINKKAIQHYMSAVRMCKDSKVRRRHKDDGIPCCVSIIANVNNSSYGARNICEYCVNNMPNFNSSINKCSILLQKKLPPLDDLRTLSANSCHEVLQNYNINQHNSLCCAQHSVEGGCKTTNGKLKRTSTDPNIRKSLAQVPQNLCTRLVLQKRYGIHSFIGDIRNVYREPVLDEFSAFGCTSNRTVNFYVMDSLHHSIYGERLGLSVKSSQPSVVLFDKEDESNYILRENFTVQTVATFVMNYSQGLLFRNQRDQPTSLSSKSLCSSNQDVCVVDVSTKTFEEVVLNQSKDVLLLYYSPWCGFCTALYHVFLSLVKYFQNSNNIVFTRINGDANDLPWEFDVEKYPTILFFPAYRKTDSVVFPDNIPKSLPNLIKFVLTHATHNLQLNSVTSLCHAQCINKNKKNSLRAISYLEKMKRKTKHRLKVVFSRKSEGLKIGKSGLITDSYSSLYSFHLKKLKTLELKIQKSTKLLHLLGNINSDVIKQSDMEVFMDTIDLKEEHGMVTESEETMSESYGQHSEHYHSEL